MIVHIKNPARKRKIKRIRKMIEARAHTHIRVTDGLIIRTAIDTLYKSLKRAEQEENYAQPE